MDKAFYKIFRRGNAAAVGKGKQAGFFQRSLLDEFRVTQHGSSAAVGNQLAITEHQCARVYSSIRCISWVIITTVTPCSFSPRRNSIMSV